jgi:hypothetical protein
MRGPETDDPKIIRDEASGKIPSWNEEENDLGGMSLGVGNLQTSK